MALALLGLVVRFARRYATRARELADAGVSPDRRQELLEIAAICERVPEHPAQTPRPLHTGVQGHALRPHRGGPLSGLHRHPRFGTAIDSLAAIRKLVFDEKRLGMAELLEALEADFEGREALRQRCLIAPKYGNDEPYADAIGHDIEELFVDITRRYRSAFGGEPVSEGVSP